MTDNPFAVPQPNAAPAGQPAQGIQPTADQAATLLAQQQQTATAQAMAMLQGLENAPVYGSGQWFQPGEYRLEVKECVIRPSSQKQGVIFFITEFVILEAELLDGPDKAYAPGATVSHIINLTQKSAPSNIKGMVMALVPTIDESRITNATVVQQLCNENPELGPVQPVAGFKVRATARKTLTREGRDFTKITYREDEATPSQPAAPAQPEGGNPLAL